jgi:hypothetical protein
VERARPWERDAAIPQGGIVTEAPDAVSSVTASGVAGTVRQLFLLAEGMGWQGYDPYDALASPWLRCLPSVSRFGARVAVQVGRRAGGLPRRLAGVAPHEEAQALADFLRAAVLLYRAGFDWPGRFLDPLRERLLAKAIRTEHGIGWGLEFPYVTRFVDVPARTPNIFQTAHAVQALLDVYELNRAGWAAEAAMGGLRFVLEDLGSFQRSGRVWLRYWPALDAAIVNVQALAAGMLARAARIFEDAGMAEQADAAVAAVRSAQHPSGYWLYEVGRARFVDGFHTGFILEGLAQYLRERATPNPAAAATLAEGLAFFRARLMSPSGLPLDHAGGRVSRDGQTVAQCVQTLAVCAETPADLAASRRVWAYLDRILPPGTAGDRRAGAMVLLRPRFPALRWAIAPAALAGAQLVHALGGREGCASP